MDFFGLDRQCDATVLTINVGEPGFDVVTYLNHRACIFDSIRRQFGGPKRTRNTVAQIDDSTTSVNFDNLAFNDRVFRILGQPALERIFVQLLDAERNALTFGIDGQNSRFDFLPLLEVVHSFFPGDIPGNV